MLDPKYVNEGLPHTTQFTILHAILRQARGYPLLFMHLQPKEKKSNSTPKALRPEKGKPHLMITMSFNGNWPEIQANLLPGQSALHRPDYCNRFFKIKLRELMRDLTRNIFGKAEYNYRIPKKRASSCSYCCEVLGQRLGKRGRQKDIG